MSLLHSILLGLVQGVAEFLPISSSGHLAIVEQILGVKGAAEVPGFFGHIGGGLCGLLAGDLGDDPGVFPGDQ